MNSQVALVESGILVNGGIGICNASASHFPALKNFYAFGDSYSAGIGANCGWIKDEFDLKGACLKCDGGTSIFSILAECAISESKFCFKEYIFRVKRCTAGHRTLLGSFIPPQLSNL